MRGWGKENRGQTEPHKEHMGGMGVTKDISDCLGLHSNVSPDQKCELGHVIPPPATPCLSFPPLQTEIALSRLFLSTK